MYAAFLKAVDYTSSEAVPPGLSEFTIWPAMKIIR